MEKKYRYALIAAGTILLLIVFAVVKIPYSYALQAKVVAGYEWLLIRQADGSLTEITRNNIDGVIQNYSSYQIDRGDLVQFRLNPDLTGRHRITRRDTVGIFHSNYVAEELARLRGELDIAYAEMKVSRTGEKQSLLEEAESQYQLNLEKARVQQKILEREAKLFSDNLVSDQDYEITRGMTRIAELEVAVAEARLQTLKTGMKQEEIELVRTRIESIQQILAAVRNRLRFSYMVSPIEGAFSLEIANDTLMTVHDSLRITIIPVPADYYNAVKPGQRISMELPYHGDRIGGEIIRVEKDFRSVAGQPVFLATALLENTGADIPTNLITPVEIAAESRTIWEHLKALGLNLFF